MEKRIKATEKNYDVIIIFLLIVISLGLGYRQGMNWLTVLRELKEAPASFMDSAVAVVDITAIMLGVTYYCAWRNWIKLPLTNELPSRWIFSASSIMSFHMVGEGAAFGSNVVMVMGLVAGVCNAKLYSASKRLVIAEKNIKKGEEI